MFRQLYERAMRSTRGGPLFNAFSYPTKISPEAIALFIAAHTAFGAMSCWDRTSACAGFISRGESGILLGDMKQAASMRI